METTILLLASLVLAGVLVAVGIVGLVAPVPDDVRRRARYRAAAPSLMAAAGPLLLLAVALVVRPPGQLADWFPVYAVVGFVTGGLIALARRRAALAAAGPNDSRSMDAEEHT